MKLSWVRAGWGLAAILFTSLSAGRSSASVIGDSFVIGAPDGYTVAPLLNQKPYVPGYSANGWNVGSSTKFSAITTGLTSSAVTYEKGGAAELVGTASDAAQLVGRTMNVPTSSTYYMSALLIRGNATVNPGGYTLVGWGTGAQPALASSGATLQGIYFGYNQSASTTTGGTLNDFGSLVIRAKRNIGGTQEVLDTLLADETFKSTSFVTFMVVAKLQVNTSGNTDTLTYWVNPTSISSEAAMTANCLITGSVPVDAVTNAASLSTQVFAESGMPATIDFDEVRIGTQLSDLALATPTPEPGALSLCFIALGFRTLSRRRFGARCP